MPKKFIISFIDFFYPPFARIIPLQTFRYAACGGANTLLGFLIYTLSYKFVFQEHDFNFGIYAFKPHIAALITAFIFNFPIGFLLMKYVVFVDSNLRGRIQLFRYFFVFVTNLFLNYVLLKILVEYLYVNAIVAQVISTVVVIIISYLLQRHFSFRIENTEVD
ncbi:MAG TPA: GtrA family protein [Puia sp.]|nr:GtrA family protein [Puia sp.]